MNHESPPTSTPHVAWIEDEQATGPIAELYAAWKQANPQRPRLPEILKCFSHHGGLLQAVMDLSYRFHFQASALDRRLKEMIATFVSGLNQCPY